MRIWTCSLANPEKCFIIHFKNFKKLIMEIIFESTDWTKVSEVELVYRSKVKSTERPLVKDSKTAYGLLLRYWDLDKIELLEDFKILLLNQANRVLGIYPLSRGGITGTVADPRLIFGAAIKASATSIILSHSHPSGNLKPSRADEELTRKISEAGRFLDIRISDHIIISKEGYFSFADEGIL
jgi:DNA repair protein RadC